MIRLYGRQSKSNVSDYAKEMDAKAEQFTKGLPYIKFKQ